MGLDQVEIYINYHIVRSVLLEWDYVGKSLPKFHCVYLLQSMLNLKA